MFLSVEIDCKLGKQISSRTQTIDSANSQSRWTESNKKSRSK